MHSQITTIGLLAEDLYSAAMLQDLFNSWTFKASTATSFNGGISGLSKRTLEDEPRVP